MKTTCAVALMLLLGTTAAWADKGGCTLGELTGEVEGTYAFTMDMIPAPDLGTDMY